MDLVLLVDAYPLYKGEFFLDEEVRHLQKKFDRIFIVIANRRLKPETGREYAQNVKIIDLTEKFSRNHLRFSEIFKWYFIAEFFRSCRQIGWKHAFSIFKIMAVDAGKALVLREELRKIIEQHHILHSNSIFYSYWHDFKALSLVFLKKLGPYTTVARAHGWDVFRKRQSPPYLSFKPLIINNLNKSYCVSAMGKTTLKQYARNHESSIQTSPLGVRRIFENFPDKKNDKIILVSCSSLFRVKRIDRIVEVLSGLDFIDFHWIHFGDGPLLDELTALAKKKLKIDQFSFKGHTKNREILEFYSRNYVDLFVNLSESEGIPVTIMEALSMEIPVLGTNVGGMAEIIQEKHGYLVKADFHPEEVREAISKHFSKDEAEISRMRTSARDFWETNFNAEKNYEKFTQQLLDLTPTERITE